jgi:hypothetical protein
VQLEHALCPIPLAKLPDVQFVQTLEPADADIVPAKQF